MSELLSPNSNLIDSALLSVADMARELSVSQATIRNWVRLGKLTPFLSQSTTRLYFQSEQLSALKQQISSKQNNLLKKRRNKQYITGNSLYKAYLSPDSPNIVSVETLVSMLEHHQTEITATLVSALLAEAALRLIQSMKSGGSLLSAPSYLAEYLIQLKQKEYSFLIDDLGITASDCQMLLKQYPALFSVPYRYVPQEDTLGFLYLSLKNMGKRKAAGAYYTPYHLAEKLIRTLRQTTDFDGRTILEPCCGTGNILLHLPPDTALSSVYACDLDKQSVAVTRINMALKYNLFDKKILTRHIFHADFLALSGSRKYDIILGNPPWGSVSHNGSAGQRRLGGGSAKKPESFVLFTEKALRLLKKCGILAFLLPEAILHVKSHYPIRMTLLKKCRFRYLEFLGNPFHQVHCPSILLQVENTKSAYPAKDLSVQTPERCYSIKMNRKLNAHTLYFTATDQEYQVLNRLKSGFATLKSMVDCTFALGIVTGDNQKHIKTEALPSYEELLKGSDIYKYKILPAGNYIHFQPQEYQQVAPEALYRADEKLVYRFIGGQPVFAYDNRQRLTLNSCNFLIPKSSQIEIKFLMAVLNSRILQFYYKKTFPTLKVLRSHIEELPLPTVDSETQKTVIDYVNRLIQADSPKERLTLYNQIDDEIRKYYNLSKQDYSIILDSLKRESLLL